MTKLKSKPRRLTLADVARASGFSPSTASIVLNEVPLSRFVAAKTKRKIQETAKRLGYRPDIFARSLRSQRSHTIGVLVIDIADPFCTLILKGIVCKLMATPYLPIIMDAHNQPHQVVRYAELMLDRRVEGLIVVANWLLFDVSVLKDISEGHLPTVVVGRDFEIHTIKSVCVDNEAGGYAALEHLYQLGHREIAFIRGPRQLADNRPRWKGIRRFANKVKLRLNPNLVQALPDTVDSTASFEESRRLVSNLILSGESFTAILAFDDISAYGAIRALSEHGLQVPADCSVIGFDDIPAAALCTPGLTTIRQPMIDMGEYAAECVLKCLEEDRNEDQTYSASRTLSPELVVRGSTAPKRSHPQKTSDITKPHTSGSEPSPIAFK